MTHEMSHCQIIRFQARWQAHRTCIISHAKPSTLSSGGQRRRRLLHWLQQCPESNLPLRRGVLLENSGGGVRHASKPAIVRSFFRRSAKVAERRTPDRRLAFFLKPLPYFRPKEVVLRTPPPPPLFRCCCS